MITESQGLRVRYGSGQCGNINNEQGILRGRFDGRHGDPYSIINQHDTDTESRSDSGVGRGAREILHNEYLPSQSPHRANLRFGGKRNTLRARVQ